MGCIFLAVVASFIVFVIVKNVKPVKKMNGKLISKSSNVYSQLSPTKFGTKSSNYTEYVFTFELENNTKVELLVDRNIYDMYSIGDGGLVSYRGNKLESFKK